MTNHEMIMQLSAEGFVKWYYEYFFRTTPYCKNVCPHHDDCEQCLLSWLESEAEYDFSTINTPLTGSRGGHMKLISTMFAIMVIALAVMIALFKGGGQP